MAEPKALTIAELFTGLTGRTVSFTQILKPLASKIPQAFGIYRIKPVDSIRILQLDLPLLGSFGGSLLGLPTETVKERLNASLADEPLRDSMQEILNVASTIVSVEDRAVFQNMCLRETDMPKDIMESLRYPAFRSYFTVTISGYEGGALSILAPI